ncbi:sensor histidine kinase [Rudanella paleaurantiibacter]|nr:sensor histidine kinase [Rudanella paleaurantiibacter]
MKRPQFFSTYEWWYHLAMMPVLFPVGNWLMIGPRYLDDARTFAVGTGLIFILYWFSVVTLTLVIRRIITRYPCLGQTRLRLLSMLLAVGALTAVLAVFDVWVYSLVPMTGVQFDLDTIRPIWWLGALFDVLLCTALGLFYSFEQWRLNQTETERLQQAALQHKLDALKGQVNPHFLFNSLSSVSALIGEDPRQAEQFVDHLARVYRYMLQAGSQPVVPLSAELDFIRTYAELLHTRYGRNLRIIVPECPSKTDSQLPALSLQTLIDNAIRHNAMLPGSPLVVRVEVGADGGVRVVNNRQHRARTVAMDRDGLSTLIAKYQMLSREGVTVEETDNRFSVTLPLLTPVAV